MDISRRDFLKYVGSAAAAIGISAAQLGMLQDVFANPSAPTVLWFQGSSCAGCSVSLLNRISTTAPATAADLLISSINLAYHPTLMAAAGATAVNAAKAAYAKGNYILVVEGGIPTAFGGAAGFAWRDGSRDVTVMEAVKVYAAKAAKVVCVGTCASFGGIPAAGLNPAGIKSVKAVTGLTTINIPGCPAHPDWVFWAVVQLLTGAPVALDANGRPSALFNNLTVHDQCPRNGATKATRFAQDGQCLMNLGCRGPMTIANCPSVRWNNKVSWCVEANSPCVGCADPSFPANYSFYSGVGRIGNV
jgi:hydrogenase small subunit